ncbi:AAA family ATPase [Lamprobacter modestohalophilus]|uniref:AAA family ATPase n=1 Tax=Lamprobacter modestohalophilus TaxID=1064514 RepID=UPI002ADEE0A9|nr:AAA family ATPase [Lamprobacter modestohalophilus]MEA1053371.1 AAA family ATPase [Lamprobacter modestohalophilus]
MLDFNEVSAALDLSAQRDALKRDLLARLPTVLRALFPAATIRGQRGLIGNIQGEPGDSLEMALAGERAGLWHDHATGEGGDLFDAIAAQQGLDTQREFTAVLEAAARLLGRSLVSPPPVRAEVPMDELGPHSAKWDYLSPSGELIACVYRYDPAPGRKEYRPWDVRARLCRAPDPRPLYNQPGLLSAETVVLVEGERCAQALIEQGIVATTAMNGAKAPVDKTDWSPLAGKAVTIWPDRDAPGWDYAEAAARACVAAGALAVAILVPPSDQPTGWDVADALEEGFEVSAFLEHGERRVIKRAPALLPTYSLGQLLDDDSPLPADLIAPRVLTPGGLLVFGGAPKVGKSDFVLAWLTHMAAGVPFLGLQPARALRVFYLQAEVQYHYLRERVQAIRLPPSRMLDARTHFVATGQLRLILNDEGLAQVIPAMVRAFNGSPPDVIAIDPIRNVFDGGEGGSENDNSAMLFFLSQRVECLRDAVNPNAGLVLVHHTKKLGKKQVEEDPFQALAGAGSLRGYYSSGMLLFRPDETRTPRELIFELRNGPAIPQKHVDKLEGVWREIHPSVRLAMQDYGERLDAERWRKREVILQILFDEAAQGRCYTTNQFAEAFEGKAGLGGERTLRERISVLSTQGYIKYFRNATDLGLPPSGRTKFGYLCVEDMVLRVPAGAVDPVTGEQPLRAYRVLPTHYKCPHSGAAMPVEHPEVWVYHDEPNAPEAR